MAGAGEKDSLRPSGCSEIQVAAAISAIIVMREALHKQMHIVVRRSSLDLRIATPVSIKRLNPS